jgi:hypothetical protein
MRTHKSGRGIGSAVVVMAAVVMAAAGCGSGSGSCGTAACGGNVVGTWTIRDLCDMTAPAMASDGGASCSFQPNLNSLKEMGTITFNSDLTYMSNLTPSGSLTEVIPTSCLGAVTCDQLNTSAMSAVTSGTYSSASCTTVTAGCSCQFQYASKAVAQTGTYTTSGSSLVVKSSSSATGETDSYCVQGSTLTISSTTSTGMTGVSASLVLTKS